MQHALRILEFDRALEYVAGFAASRVGRRRVEGLRPQDDAVQVARELAAVDEVVRRTSGPTEAVLPSFPDGDEALARLGIEGSVLTAAELWSLGVLLEVGRGVAEGWRPEGDEAPLLAELIGRVVKEEALEKRILRSVDGDGAVLDTASKDLARLRQQLQGRHTRVVRHLETVLQGLDDAHRVSDASVTIREGRYVIPVRREGKGRVGGYVHDESASGATLFVEPPSAIELMNEIRGLEREEAREVQRILRELSDACRPLSESLAGSVDALAELDSRRARALAARAWDGSRPHVGGSDPGFGDPSSEEGGSTALDIRSGRHPLLLASGIDVVPFDLRLEEGERVVLVSGPNTGGKTVFLKSVGLISALAQAGVIPPVAPGSRLPVFGSFFADVGDEQSLAQSLSTFSAHLKNLREIVDEAGRDSLVLMDELGTGTDPKEGEALSRAILETLADSGCMAVVTSHLGGLRRLAGEGSSIVNASMQFDADQMAPSYQFRKGRPGRSYGLAIARGLGFPSELLDRAEAYRDETEARLDDVLQNLEAKERETARLVEALAAERDRVARLTADVEGRAQSLDRAEKEHSAKLDRVARQRLLEARKEVEEAIRRLEERVAAGAVMEEAAREARRSVEAAARRFEGSAPAPAAEAARDVSTLAAGTRVQLRESGAAGTVLGVEGDRVALEVGGLRIQLPAEALERLEDQTPVTSRAKGATHWIPQTDARTELDLRGQRADEAEAALVRALDDAALVDLGELRIIHGKGTGALKARVTQVLEADPRVEEFRPGGPGEGGHGVTVARIR